MRKHALLRLAPNSQARSLHVTTTKAAAVNVAHRALGSMTGSFHKPKEEAAGEPRESLAKRRARAKTMENLASGR